MILQFYFSSQSIVITVSVYQLYHPVQIATNNIRTANFFWTLKLLCGMLWYYKGVDYYVNTSRFMVWKY